MTTIRRQRLFLNWEETCQECGHVQSGVVSLGEQEVEELALQLGRVMSWPREFWMSGSDGLSRLVELHDLLTRPELSPHDQEPDGRSAGWP